MEECTAFVFKMLVVVYLGRRRTFRSRILKIFTRCGWKKEYCICTRIEEWEWFQQMREYFIPFNSQWCFGRVKFSNHKELSFRIMPVFLTKKLQRSSSHHLLPQIQKKRKEFKFPFFFYHNPNPILHIHTQFLLQSK